MAKDVRPVRPGVVGGAFAGRPGKNFKLNDRPAALPVHRTQTIGTGVAPAYNDHAFVLRRNEVSVGNVVAFTPFVLEGQEFHCEADALQFASGYLKISRSGGTTGQKDRIEFAAQLLNRHIDSDIRVGAEHDAFFQHDIQPPVKNLFLHLEFGYPVTQEAPNSVVSFVHRHPVSRLIQLSCRGQSCRSVSDDRYGFSCTPHRPARPDDAFLKRAIDDRDFDVFDSDGIGISSDHAGTLAGCGAEAACKLGKVVRRQKTQQRFLPLPSINEIIPVRNDVSQWTALMTEGNAAVHATRRLGLEFVFRKFLVDLVPVLDPLLNRPAFETNSSDFKKAFRITHTVPLRTSLPLAPSSVPALFDSREA